MVMTITAIPYISIALWHLQSISPHSILINPPSGQCCVTSRSSVLYFSDEETESEHRLIQGHTGRLKPKCHVLFVESNPSELMFPRFYISSSTLRMIWKLLFAISAFVLGNFQDSLLKQIWAIQNSSCQKKFWGDKHNFFLGKCLIDVYQKQGMS